MQVKGKQSAGREFDNLAIHDRVSKMGSTGGSQFGQNGQKLHENYKIEISESKQWEDMGGQTKFILQL